MSLGLEKVVLLISSYSNPVETLRHANKEGYILRDFLLTNMPFGTYSSELKVMYLTFSTQAHVPAMYLAIHGVSSECHGARARWSVGSSDDGMQCVSADSKLSGASSYSGRGCMHAWHVLAT